MYKALLVDELNPTTDLSNDCPTFGLIEYIILEKRENTVDTMCLIHLGQKCLVWMIFLLETQDNHQNCDPF